MRKVLLFLSFNLISLFLLAQDIHFSQFHRSYLNLNPALNGSFDADYRLNANYKNQWSAVSEPYRTFSFSAEAKSLFKKQKNIHLGLILFNDEAGLGGLQTTQFALNIAYSKGLNYDSTLILKAGVQSGVNARSINFNRFSYDRQFDGNVYNPNLESGESFDRSSYTNFALHAGIALEYIIENRKSFGFGYAAYNLNRSNQSFEGSNIPLDVRSNWFIQADYYLSEKIDLLPAILYSHQGTFKEVLFGSDMRYRIDESSFKNENVYFGLWYRNKDALILSAGVDYRKLNFGISYDINVSGLDVASDNRGGLELSLTYLIKYYKPKIRRYQACPDFM